MLKVAELVRLQCSNAIPLASADGMILSGCAVLAGVYRLSAGCTVLARLAPLDFSVSALPRASLQQVRSYPLSLRAAESAGRRARPPQPALWWSMMWRTHAGDAAPDPNETIPRRTHPRQTRLRRSARPVPRRPPATPAHRWWIRLPDRGRRIPPMPPPPRGLLSRGLLDRTERVLHKDDRAPYLDCVTPAMKAIMHVYVADVNGNTHNEKDIDARGAIRYVLATFFDIVESESARKQARGSRRSSGEAGVQSRRSTRFVCEMGSRVGRCFYAWRALGTSKTLVADSIARR